MDKISYIKPIDTLEDLLGWYSSKVYSKEDIELLRSEDGPDYKVYDYTTIATVDHKEFCVLATDSGGNVIHQYDSFEELEQKIDSYLASKKKFQFNWDEFTEKNFAKFCNDVTATSSEDPSAEHISLYGMYYGCVRVGDLCFDLMCYEDDSNDLHRWIPVLGFDLYVGGIDDGYGYTSKENYPYTEADGGDFPGQYLLPYLTYEEFKKIAEEEFTNYINAQGDRLHIIDKAKQPLHKWN